MSDQSDIPYKTVNIKELGPRLPIGVEGPGGLDKTLKLLPYKFKHEREIAAELTPGTRGGQYVNIVLGKLVEQFGPHKFTEMSAAEREAVLHSIYYPDVLYAFVYLRIMAIGPSFKVSIDHCREPQEVIGDLESADVRVVDKPAQLLREVRLRDGLIVGGKTRKQVVVQPSTWGSLDLEAARSEVESIQMLAMLKTSIHSVEGVEGPPHLIDEDVDEMSKYDWELLKATITDATPGIEFVLEGQPCVKCRQPLRAAIPWHDPGFFGVSSPSRRKAS